MRKLKKNINIQFRYGNTIDGQNPVVISNVSGDDLKKVYGCPAKTSEEGTSWKVLLKVKWVAWDNKIVSTVGNEGHDIYITELYSGSELKDKENDKDTKNDSGDNSDYEWAKENVLDDGEEAGEDVNSAAENIGEAINSALDTIDTLAHLPELIVSKIASLILGVADAIQAGANAIPSMVDSAGITSSTSASEISDAKEVLHSYDELKSNAEKGNNLDKYTKVSAYKQGKEVVKRIEVPADCDGNKTASFTKDTYIPVISGDLYNIAVDHVDFFDINFLTGGKEKKSDGKGLKHAENSNWSNLTKFASTVIRICIYIASSILIVSIIYSGYNIVKNTLDNPQARAKEKERLDKIKNGVVIIVGSVMVMALCIYASKGLFSGIAKTDSYEMPIRVDVEGLYSFSTSVTGYIRYMASTTDLEECGQRIQNAGIYLGLVVCNALAICMMVVRMIAVWLLSMIGPFIAILYVFDKKDFNAFVTWVKAYSAIALFPPIFIRIIYTIMLG